MSVQGILIANLPAAVSPPAAAPANFAGVAEVWLMPSPGGTGLTERQPYGVLPIYHADLAGPTLAAGTPVVVTPSNGGKYYISAAPGYQGLTPAAVVAQLGFTGF